MILGIFTTISFKAFQHLKRNPIPIKSLSISPISSPRQPPICFLFFMSLFAYSRYINKWNNVIYVVLCNWLLSFDIMCLSFIHFVAWITTFFLLNNIPLYEYTTFYLPTTSWWIFGLFPLWAFQIMPQLQIFVWTYKWFF